MEKTQKTQRENEVKGRQKEAGDKMNGQGLSKNAELHYVQRKVKQGGGEYRI